MSKPVRGWPFWSFAGYCVLMIWLLYGQRIGNWGGDSYFQQLKSSCNLIPLKTIGNYWRFALRTTNQAMLRHIIINLAGNVIIFIPLGFFLPLNWSCFRSFRKLLGWSIIIVAAIELIQLFTLLGSLDVDDLILNIVGVAIGYGIWKLTGR